MIDTIAKQYGFSEFTLLAVTTLIKKFPNNTEAWIHEWLDYCSVCFYLGKEIAGEYIIDSEEEFKKFLIRIGNEPDFDILNEEYKQVAI